MCTFPPTQYIKMYRFEAILEPLVSDLKVFETKGIKVLSGSVQAEMIM